MYTSQRAHDVYTTSYQRRRIDVEATLYRRHVSAVFIGHIIKELYFCQKHMLWVPIRNASARYTIGKGYSILMGKGYSLTADLLVSSEEMS